jgi:hypothetical protein
VSHSFDELSNIYSAVYQLLKSSYLSPSTRRQVRRLLVDLGADVDAALHEKTTAAENDSQEVVPK